MNLDKDQNKVKSPRAEDTGQFIYIYMCVCVCVCVRAYIVVAIS